MADKHAVTMDKIVNLCKARGIIFPGSEIYGGMGHRFLYRPEDGLQGVQGALPRG